MILVELAISENFSNQEALLPASANFEDLKLKEDLSEGGSAGKS